MPNQEWPSTQIAKIGVAVSSVPLRIAQSLVLLGLRDAPAALID